MEMSKASWMASSKSFTGTSKKANFFTSHNLWFWALRREIATLFHSFSFETTFPCHGHSSQETPAKETSVEKQLVYQHPVTLFLRCLKGRFQPSRVPSWIKLPILKLQYTLYGIIRIIHNLWRMTNSRKDALSSMNVIRCLRLLNAIRKYVQGVISQLLLEDLDLKAVGFTFSNRKKAVKYHQII